ncbi:hypothetical protein ACSBR2_014269 [Camellia fascicularis]
MCGAPQLQVPPCHTSSPHQSRTKQMLLVVCILLPIASILLAMIFVFVFIRCHKRRNKIPIKTDLLLPRISHGRITYHELSRATDMFSENNLLGTRSFSSVYKGMLPGRKIFAMKVFKLELDCAFKSFETKCEILRKIRHRNLTKRFDIMIDVACDLEYLHHGYSMSVAHEYGLEGLVSTKCDVYSYCIMLMETFTRTKSTDARFNGGLSLKCWVVDALHNAIVQVLDANLLRCKGAMCVISYAIGFELLC